MKHEWRKKKKQLYFPKNRPELINIPELSFLTVAGEGNPNNSSFQDYIQVLYSLSYAIKMNLKKGPPPEGYMDYTVYPLEGVWDIHEEAQKTFDGQLNKDDLVFTLMIRQPEFVDRAYVEKMRELTKTKKPHRLLDEVKFEKMTDGLCVQMMHLGSFDDEPASFKEMEAFAAQENLIRESKIHREIYLTDFRKVSPDKLKTVLRFKVKEGQS